MSRFPELQDYFRMNDLANDSAFVLGAVLARDSGWSSHFRLLYCRLRRALCVDSRERHFWHGAVKMIETRAEGSS